MPGADADEMPQERRMLTSESAEETLQRFSIFRCININSDADTDDYEDASDYKYGFFSWCFQVSGECPTWSSSS